LNIKDFMANTVKRKIFDGGFKILIQREFGKGPMLTKQGNLSFSPNISRFTV